MKIGFIGTGFVADYYMTTLKNHPELQLCGVFDRSAARMQEFAAFHGVPAYDSAEALLGDPEIRIVVNLTTPESHFEVSRQALEAGKHVYCEKPLAMNVEDAAQLVALAEARGLTLATAPANALSDAHRLVSSALDAGRIGTPRLVYAEMEDGPVFRSNWAELALAIRRAVAGPARIRDRLHARTCRLCPVMAGVAVRCGGKPHRIFGADLSRQGTRHAGNRDGA